jgi:hypothetical protein
MLREFHTHFPLGTACDLRKVVLMLSHFRNWDHALLFMDNYFLHVKSQHNLYYPRQEEHIDKKPQLISTRRKCRFPTKTVQSMQRRRQKKPKIPIKKKQLSRVSLKRKVQDLMDCLLSSIRPLKKN